MKPNGDEYKMSMSEFKGQTTQSLADIKVDISNLQKAIQDIQNQLNNQKLISAVMGGVTGVIGAILNPFKNV